MKLKLFLFLIFWFAVCSAQENKLYFDTQLQKLNDSLRVAAVKNPQLGLQKAEELLSISKKKKNPYYEVRAMYVKDFIYSNIEDYKSLLKNVDKTIELAEKYNFYVSAFESSQRKVVGLMHLGLFPEAKKGLDKNYFLLDILAKKEKFISVGSYWNDYGDFYNMQGNDKKAIKMFNKAVVSFQKVKKPQERNANLVAMYTNIGNSYIFASEIDSAFIYYKYAEELFPVTKDYDKRNEAAILYGYGVGYNKKKQYQKAVQYLMKSFDLSEKNNYQDIYIESLKEISISYENIKDKEKDPYYINFLAAQEKYVKKNDITVEELQVVKEQNSNFYDRNKYFIWIFSGAIFLTLCTITYYQSQKRTKIEIEKKEISEVVKEQSDEISVLKTKVNEAFDEVLELAKNNDPAFLKRFSEVYPEFYTNLISKNSELTATQLKIIALSFLNFSTKDISMILSISIRTTQNHKYNIRKVVQSGSKSDEFLKFFF